MEQVNKICKQEDFLTCKTKYELKAKHIYLLTGKIDAFIWRFEPPLVSRAVPIQQTLFNPAWERDRKNSPQF